MVSRVRRRARTTANHRAVGATHSRCYVSRAHPRPIRDRNNVHPLEKQRRNRRGEERPRDYPVCCSRARMARLVVECSRRVSPDRKPLRTLVRPFASAALSDGPQVVSSGLSRSRCRRHLRRRVSVSRSNSPSLPAPLTFQVRIWTRGHVATLSSRIREIRRNGLVCHSEEKYFPLIACNPL